MRKRLFVSVVVLAVFAVVAAVASAGPAPQTAPGDPLDPRTYDPDSRLFLVAHAIGVQKYTCQANGMWLFTDPEATLYKTTGASQPIGTHFLNFATGRPVWQLRDGSSVEAARSVTVSGGAGNIAWLLLDAVATGGERLGSTAWAQRLNTSGGVAPTGTCTPGATLAAPYTADYLFWRRRDVFRDPVDECREWLDLAAWPEARPLVVGAAAENDRVLGRDLSGKLRVHRVVPAEERIWGLGNPVEGQQLVHDDLSHALHLRLVSTY
jgi:Protein of unknown function (DUF3455)